MKTSVKSEILPLFTLGAGGLGFALRLWLFATGVDQKGLLVAGHPATVLTFILTAAIMAVLFFYTAKTPKLSYTEAFPRCRWAAVGNWIAAAGILAIDTAELIAAGDAMTVVCFVTGVAAAAGLVYLGICRLQQKQPSMFFHSAVTVYMILHLICQYRSWSPEPQLQTYCFQLFASVLLMLSVYHRTALAAGDGSCRWFYFCNQASLFFCCLSLQGESRLFYLTMGAWMALDTMAFPQPQPEEITDVSSQ